MGVNEAQTMHQLVNWKKQGRFLIFQTDLETKILCCYSFKSSGILAHPSTMPWA
jgi:hypothetical protein